MDTCCCLSALKWFTEPEGVSELEADEGLGVDGRAKMIGQPKGL
jgi:hypothetical protein